MYVTVATLKRKIKNHGDDWRLLINGHPVDEFYIKFGYPEDYPHLDEDDYDEPTNPDNFDLEETENG